MRLAKANEEVEACRLRVRAIDADIASIPTAASGFASILSELTGLIDGEICPACDRDYADVEDGTLVEHIHGKVRRLSSSANRLLDLGRMRTEAQIQVDRLDREIAALQQAVLGDGALAELDRMSAALETTRLELMEVSDILKRGTQLRAAEVSAKRAVNYAQS